METKIDLRSTIYDFRFNDKMQMDLLYWAKMPKGSKPFVQTQNFASQQKPLNIKLLN
jgi:hypothetical protein